MRKILSLVLVFALLAFMAVPAMAAHDEFVIGFDMNSNACAYCLQFSKYIEEFANEAGMKAIITQADGSVATQISNVENMLTQGAKVVAGIWGDKDAALPVADLCAANDAVCVSTLTSLANEGNGYAKYIYLGSENYDGGYLQGEFLASVADKENTNKIWFMSSTAGDQQGIDRQAGFEAALKDNNIPYEIAAFEYTDNYMDRGLIVMENWVQAYEDIGIVVGTADLSVLGAITAYEAAGRDVSKVTWIGLDGQDAALESISEGKMTMTVFQNAKAQAKAFVDLCVQIRDGADASQIEDLNIPFESITKDNCMEYMGNIAN